MSNTHFAILGCGSAAVPVAQAITSSPHASLALVHDIVPALARDLGEHYHVPYTTELDELLNATDIDAIYIAVPHHLLAPLTKQVLTAGKHALVEKPMALTLTDADDLISFAESEDLTLGVFYEMRYAPGFAFAREIVQGNALGEIIGVRMQTLIDKAPTYWQAGYMNRSVNSWRGEQERAGGGVVLMNASHLLDALWYVTGLNITRVSAERDTLVANVEVEDTASATFRFDNGAVGSLFSGAHIAGAHADEWFDIYGTRGTLRVSDPYHSKPLQIFLRDAWRDTPAQTWHELPIHPINVFESAINDFAQALQSHRPAPINGHDARRVLEIILAIYESAEQNIVETLRRNVSSLGMLANERMRTE